jgi:hypothetical protein
MSSSIYKTLLLLNNLVAFFFLGLIVLGSYSVSPEAANPLSDQQIFVWQLLYGIAVSLFFSLISLIIGVVLRKKISLTWRYLGRLFFIQFSLLAFVYAIISLFISLK